MTVDSIKLFVDFRTLIYLANFIEDLNLEINLEKKEV